MTILLVIHLKQGGGEYFILDPGSKSQRIFYEYIIQMQDKYYNNRYVQHHSWENYIF